MKIKTGNIGTFKVNMFNIHKLLYSGMPNSQTFALSPIVDEGSSFSPVIYYPIDSEIISVLHQKFKVKEINANYIEIDLIKN